MKLGDRPAANVRGRLSGPLMPVFAALVIAALAVPSSPARGAPGDEIYTRPGQLVEADGARLNTYCTGSGSPTCIEYIAL